MKLEWKEFNVNLKTVLLKIHDIAPSITGLSTPSFADGSSCLRVDGEITSEQAIAIRDYWDELTETDLEATSYRSGLEIKAAIEAAKLDAVDKTYDLLSVAQRKILLGLTPTSEELGI